MLSCPPHWPRVALGELAIVKNGVPLPSSGFNAEKGTPVVRIRNVLEGRTDTFFDGQTEDSWFVAPGDLLVGMDGDFNASRWRGPRAVLNQRVCMIAPRDNRVSVQYLAYVLPGYLAAINKHTPSITVKHLSSRTIAEIPLPVPPAKEQAALLATIDAHFSRLDAAIVSLTRAKDNVKRARASVLKAAVEGRLVPTEAALARAEGRDYEPASALLARILTERRARWAENGSKGKYKEPIIPDPAELSQLPQGWAWATVSQLGDVETGTTPPTQELANYAETGLPFLKPTDLDQGANVNTARQFLSATGAAVSRQLPPLSVLVTCIGATIGKTGLARVECATNQQINAFVPSQFIRESRYGFCFFESPMGQQAVIGNASATTLPILNKSRFSTIPVPLPPLAEQHRIVAEVDRRLSVLDALNATIDANLTRCAKLRQSILKRAFEGRLVKPAAPTKTKAAPQIPLFTEEAAP
nr:restriction endonuclease subunit S [Nannocystis sp. SCPEA4]